MHRIEQLQNVIAGMQKEGIAGCPRDQVDFVAGMLHSIERAAKGQMSIAELVHNLEAPTNSTFKADGAMVRDARDELERQGCAAPMPAVRSALEAALGSAQRAKEPGRMRKLGDVTDEELIDLHTPK